MALESLKGGDQPRKGIAMKDLRNERGVTLVETLIAILIALIGVFGLGSLVFQASATSKNQGTETTRAVIYAQDKIEGLLSLASVATGGGRADFTTCTQSASTQPAVCNTTGVTSVTGWTTGLLAGGSTSPLQATCPSSGANVAYMDFLDSTGCQVNACASPMTSLCGNANPTVTYVRQWQIVDSNPFGSTPALKKITVAVYSLSAVNTNGGKPVVVVTTDISDPN